MPAVDVIKNIGQGLIALGTRRLVALGVAGVVVFLLVGISGYLLSQPEREILYSGLDQQDVTGIGAVLGDSGIGFDVNTAGDTVLVKPSETAKARMILAQKGLPRSGNSGYELFDKMGSIGLTSFMQQVTKVRALEGELARTIQLIDGVRAARVHLALRTDGVLRSERESAAASVIIRQDEGSSDMSARAIRHLVAAAIPGLAADQVTVMNTDGTLLSSGEDSVNAAPEKLIGLERLVSSDIERNIIRTLTPYLGVDNLRVSVAAKLNADKRQTSEVAFDPNSRVERSIRTFKESGQAENASGTDAVSVDQNIPQEDSPKASGDSTKEKKDRREEVTNFEINSKSVATTSEGYDIERLSIAVVVNRAQLLKPLGETPTPEAIAAQVTELEQLVRSASGASVDRGDQIKISPVDFSTGSTDLEALESGGVADLLVDNLSSFVNAGALILVTILVLTLGLRPALRVIVPTQGAIVAQQRGSLADFSEPSTAMGGVSESEAGRIGQRSADPLLDDLARQVSNGPRDRLVKIVELDPERAADVLRQWLNEPSGNRA